MLLGDVPISIYLSYMQRNEIHFLPLHQCANRRLCGCADNNATTPVYPEVADAMWPYLTDCFGNPSSNHAFSLPCKRALQVLCVCVWMCCCARAVCR